ncbi:MAG: restriction endonuclease subunit S [Qipengyuania sp.]|nr:restriction endonuclease subunit S [Qipengyuania sp.]
MKNLGWETRPLAEWVQFQRGLTYKKSDEVPFSGNAVLRANNIDRLTGMLNLEEIRYIRDDVEVHDRLKVRAGSLLICTASGSKSHLGKVALIEEALDFAFGGFMGLLIPNPGLDPRYLFYVTRSSLYDDFIDSLSDGANINNLKFSDLGKLAVPIPPLEEQKRIVAVLDQAFAALDRARALAEANLGDAEELFENTLEAVFEQFASSDLILPLGEAVHPDCKLSYGIVQPGDDVASGLPIVRPVDLGRPIISLAGLKRISSDRADGFSRTKLTGAELLLCVRGTTGEVSMASPELAGANVTRGIVPVRFDPAKVDLEFAYFQMRSPFMRKQIAKKTYGAALMQINIKDVRELKFVRPSLDIQRKAKAEVRQLHDRAERLIGDYQAKLDDLASLRQALLQQAFSGELT